MLLLVETAWLTSRFGLDELNVFGNRVHHMLKLGSSVDDGSTVESDDMSVLEVDAEEEGFQLEEVDQIVD